MLNHITLKINQTSQVEKTRLEGCIFVNKYCYELSTIFEDDIYNIHLALPMSSLNGEWQRVVEFVNGTSLLGQGSKVEK